MLIRNTHSNRERRYTTRQMGRYDSTAHNEKHAMLPYYYTDGVHCIFEHVILL